MKKLLLGQPMLNSELRAKLENIGVDTTDSELATIAALLNATVLQKALDGDLDAIKMALEMGGQAVTAKDQTERAKLELEREKVKLLAKAATPAGNDMPVINITMGGETPPESE